MTVAFGMVFVGGLLVYGGWTNRSVWALARGDNTVAKSPTVAASVSPSGIQGPAVPVGPTSG